METEVEGGDYSSLGEGEGDSSGCSSGHESVVSSLTAGTHISSDSGTEADQLHNQVGNHWLLTLSLLRNI